MAQKIAKKHWPKKKLHIKVPYYKDSILIKKKKKIGDATLPNNFKNCLIHPQ